MSALTQLLHEMERSINKKDIAELRKLLKPIKGIFENTLKVIPLDCLKSSKFLSLFLAMEPGDNEGLKELQTILALKQDNTDPESRAHVLFLCHLALQLCVMQAKKDKEDSNSLQLLSGAIEEDIERENLNELPYDLSFLAPSWQKTKVSKQALLGKPPKKENQIVFTRVLKPMNPVYWEKDETRPPYFTTAEKKQFKVERLSSDHLLHYRSNPDDPITDGSYNYIISPKGSLYLVSDMTHHSLLRAGQPVLCAGTIDVKNGEIIQINPDSGHYHPSNYNLKIACLHLYEKGILNEKCQIKPYGEPRITVKDLLTDDEFAPIRQAYENIKAGKSQIPPDRPYVFKTDHPPIEEKKSPSLKGPQNDSAP